MDRETKQETSIPVAARVSMVSLAEMVNYWEHEGYTMRSMSQLVAWSIDLLCETIKRNESMPVVIETVAEAHRHLEQRGLYQGSLKARAFQKIGGALRFETLRSEGIDPKTYVPLDYNIAHNKRSVEPSPMIDDKLTDDELRKIAEKRLTEIRLAKQREAFELKQQTKKAIDERRKNGTLASEPTKDEPDVKEGMGEKEFYDKAKKRDQEQIEKENAPLDMEYLKNRTVRSNNDQT